MNELHVVVIVSQVPEFVCKQLRKTVITLQYSCAVNLPHQQVATRWHSHENPCQSESGDSCQLVNSVHDVSKTFSPHIR